MADGIQSIEELKKAQAAAQAAGSSITNYQEWKEILEDLDAAGIKGTGNYNQDKQLHNQMMHKLESFIQEVQQAQQKKESEPVNEERSKIESKTSSDKEQILKANVANATSSVILSDYMKYYHMLQ